MSKKIRSRDLGMNEKALWRIELHAKKSLQSRADICFQ